MGRASVAGDGNTQGAGRRTLRLRLLATALIVGLAGCATAPPPANGPTGPSLTDIPPPEPTVTSPDAETLAAMDHYRQIEANYLSQGLLQTNGGTGVAFSASDLAQNFLAIAFHDEFTETGRQLIAGGRERSLHKWERPVRVALEFGASVPLAARRSDRAEIAAYLGRLTRITGLPIRLAATNANFLILVQAPPERRGAGERILRFAGRTSPAALASAIQMKQDIYCTAFSYSPGRRPYYDRSLVIVRSELPPLMRKACYHEEVAQGLGLVNDSPRARPSIFNDANEFALLTLQDELLLKILYDPRLTPGMTLAEAQPIVETIAAELVSGGS